MSTDFRHSRIHAKLKLTTTIKRCNPVDKFIRKLNVLLPSVTRELSQNRVGVIITELGIGLADI